MEENYQMDNAFSVETDVVKLNDVGKRLVIEGNIGKIMKIRFANDFLEINGLEAKLKIKLNEEELKNCSISKYLKRGSHGNE